MLASIHPGLCALVFAALAGRVRSSRINFYSDQKCKSFSHDRDGPDASMSGESCALLEADGEFGSFKVMEMDHRCAVTIYKPVQDPTVTCNPDTALWAQVGDCFAASAWTWYTITDCVIPAISSNNSTTDSSSSSSSTSESSPSGATSTASSPTQSSIRLLTDTSPSPTATDSAVQPGAGSAESESSATEAPARGSLAEESNKAAIAGGVAGGVVGVGLVAGAVWYCLSRRKNSSGVEPLGPVEMSSGSRVEMSASGDAEKSAAVEMPQHRYSARPELYSNGLERAGLFSPMMGATYSPVTDGSIYSLATDMTLFSPGAAHIAEMSAEKEGTREMQGTFHPAHRWSEKPPV